MAGDRMTPSPEPRPSAVVLAAGEGQRLHAFTERWLGRRLPKQYCTFVGTRSMLDHTLDRSAEVCALERTLVVTARSHRGLLAARRARRSDGQFVYQPSNRDTAAGVLLGLSHLVRRAPELPVVVFPSDHFIHPEWRFLRVVRAAVAASGVLTDQVILLGAPPDRLELDYGWITPGARAASIDGRPVFEVASFLEKPGREQALAARRDGALWNTMIVVARTWRLWELVLSALPELRSGFERLAGAVGTARELAVLEEVYQTLPPRNFSAGVLEQAPGRALVMEMPGVTWSDWGRPGRILHSVLALRREPHFSRRDVAGVA